MEKYTTQPIIDSLAGDIAAQKEEEKKIIVSNDAYAIIDILMIMLERLRLG